MEASLATIAAIADPTWDESKRLLLKRFSFLPAEPCLETHGGGTYLSLLNRAARELQLTNANGIPIEFIDADQSNGTSYEGAIFETGQVATRVDRASDAWHDYFNALMWLTWPLTKAALNRQQVHEQLLRNVNLLGSQFSSDAKVKHKARSAAADRLTLFDESGAVIVCTPRLEDSLRSRDWNRLFVFERAAHAAGDFNVCLLGHGLLQKLQKPFKAISAQVVVVPLDNEFKESGINYWDRQSIIDRRCAALISQLPKPLPLPLMGLPGWHRTWLATDQDDEFYNDAAVFRP